VEIDCDPWAGTFHNPEDWVAFLERLIGGNTHYYPSLKLEKVVEGNRHGDKWEPSKELTEEEALLRTAATTMEAALERIFMKNYLYPPLEEEN
jgi:hypothetical protein